MSEGGEASAPSPHPAQGKLGSSPSEGKQSVPLTLMGGGGDRSVPAGLSKVLTDLGVASLQGATLRSPLTADPWVEAELNCC